MQLWFIRHARAVDREETSLPDFQRPLTPKGRKQFTALCRELARRVSPPQLLLTSPLIRAVQTAEIVTRAFELPATACQTLEPLGPDLTPEKLQSLLAPLNVDSVALVGHEPSLGECLSAAIGGGSLKLVKGAVALVELPSPIRLSSGELRWLVAPKLFE